MVKIATMRVVDRQRRERFVHIGRLSSRRWRCMATINMSVLTMRRRRKRFVDIDRLSSRIRLRMATVHGMWRKRLVDMGPLSLWMSSVHRGLVRVVFANAELNAIGAAVLSAFRTTLGREIHHEAILVV